jgi:hypothetical protein
MVLNPIFLGGVWFIIRRYSVFHTFIWRGWVGGLSQMKLTSFEKNCHILRRSLTMLSAAYVVQTLMTMTADRDICHFYCQYFEVIESQSQKFGMPLNFLVNV